VKSRRFITCTVYVGLCPELRLRTEYCERALITCLPVRPAIWPASSDHDLVPWRCT
jgi:hypothetical protein